MAERASRRCALGGALGSVAPWACVAMLAVSSCRKGPSSPPPAVPVLAAVVEQRDVPREVRNIGTVEAHSTVSVKSLIGGALLKVHIQEGQAVEKGDVLFTIDSRPYQAALDEAEANLARDTAEYDSAVRDANRVEKLFQEKAATQYELDTAQTQVQALAAAVKGDKAAIETARIQLGYCRIDSPLHGVTGELLVNEGNIVKANDVSLITINQVQPIYVTFSVPQQYLRDIRRYSDHQHLRVDVYAMQGGGQLGTGELAFIDNTVDPATGTIRLKGLFANADQALWPGQYVSAVLTLTVDKGALVVPTQALQVGQEGQFVYVIRDDMTVVAQPVTLQRTADGGAVVTGLAAGQRIVTDGQLRLSPGARVEIKPALIGPAPSERVAAP